MSADDVQVDLVESDVLTQRVSKRIRHRCLALAHFTVDRHPMTVCKIIVIRLPTQPLLPRFKFMQNVLLEDQVRSVLNAVQVALDPLPDVRSMTTNVVRDELAETAIGVLETKAEHVNTRLLVMSRIGNEVTV